LSRRRGAQRCIPADELPLHAALRRRKPAASTCADKRPLSPALRRQETPEAPQGGRTTLTLVISGARSIGYLGPHGTFTEQAVLSDPELAACERRLYSSMPAVLNAVEAGEIDLGFAAIENSIEGTVNATIDTLAFSSQLMIQREIVIPISMELLVAPGTTLDSIETVVSFPHAIAQCRIWLAEHLPQARHAAANSTADAVDMVAKAGDPTMAAIGNHLAGRIYKLDELFSDIQDNADNQTRFVTVAREGVPKITGHDKTSIVIFQRDDRPGSLLSILQEFSAREINLSKLESRPTKKGLGNYCFIMDLDGHISDEVVADALQNIMAKQADVKFLGSYPAAGHDHDEVRAEANAAWKSAKSWLEGLRAQVYE
jgi:prephenate dehydratase